MGFWTGYGTGSSSGGSTKPPAPPKAAASFWGGYTAKQTPAAAPPSDFEKKIVSSFLSLPESNRNDTLGRLDKAAKKGDQAAARKLQLLVPLRKSSIPQTPNYGSSSKLWQSLSGIATDAVGMALHPFDGGTAGEGTVPRLPNGKVAGEFQAGSSSDIPTAIAAKRPDLVKQGLRDQAIQGVEARFMYGKVPMTDALLARGGVQAAEKAAPKVASTLIKPVSRGTKIIKGAKDINRVGMENAAGNVLNQGTSDNARNLSGSNLQESLGHIAATAGEGYGFGAGFKTAGKAVRGVAKTVARNINVPAEQVAHLRVARDQPELYKSGDGKAVEAAVKTEMDRIKSDPVQSQLVAQAYDQGGSKSLTADTGYHQLAQDVAGRSHAVNDSFQSAVKIIADETGAIHVPGPSKQAARIHEKAVNDYGGDVAKVQDATRATVTLGSAGELNKYIQAIGKQFEVVRVKNGLDNAGYQDVKVNVRLPNGDTGEILLATPEMLKAKNELGGHKLYEQARGADVPTAVREQLEAEMKRIYSAAGADSANRLASSSEISRPSVNALATEKGALVETTRQRSTLPSDVSTTTTLSTSKKRLDSVVTGESPFSSTVAQNGNTVKEAPNAPVNQTVDETLATPDATSRVKQYEESLQAAITGIEKAPGYQAELAAKGGGEVIGNKETYAKAKAAGPMDPDEIKNWQAGQPSDSVSIVRAKATLDVVAKEFTDKWQSGALDPGQLDAAAEELAKLEAGYHVMTAEPGRATQIQSTFVAKQYERAKELERLIKETKGPNRSALIEKGIKEFGEASEKAEKSGAVPKSTAARWTDMLVEYATATKLTSPLTHLVNIASSLITLPTRALEGTITTGLQAAKGHTGVRSLKYAFGSAAGVRQAVVQFGHDFVQAWNPVAVDLADGTSKADMRAPAISGKNVGLDGKVGRAVDIAGKAVRTPFNLLSAADNFFKNVLRDSEIHQQAYAKGYQEGFRGPQLASRIQELVTSPTDGMKTRAELVAKEHTFTSEPGPLAKGIIKTLSHVPLLRLLVPFVSTPTNLAKYQIQRTPIGLFAPRNVKDLVKGGIGRDEAIARLGVGGMMSVGAVMAAYSAADNITGPAPSDKGEKDNFYATGKKPYAVKIGDHWVQYNRFQPIGMYLTQAVGLRDALQRGDSKTAGNLFTSMAIVTAKGLADLPFVQGVSGVIDALNNPSDQTAMNKAFGGVITGLLPNIGRDIAGALDSNQPRNAKTITDQIKLMIPGKRGEVSPRVTGFGAEQQVGGSQFERGSTAITKIVSKDTSSELSRALDDIGKESGYYPQAPQRNAKVRGKVLSNEEYDKYSRVSGQKLQSKLQKALGDTGFTGASPEDKAADLQTMVTDARKQAADEIFGKAGKKTTPRKAKHY